VRCAGEKNSAHNSASAASLIASSSVRWRLKTARHGAGTAADVSFLERNLPPARKLNLAALGRKYRQARVLQQLGPPVAKQPRLLSRIGRHLSASSAFRKASNPRSGRT
jgi:hypothetical protein